MSEERRPVGRGEFTRIFSPVASYLLTSSVPYILRSEFGCQACHDTKRIRGAECGKCAWADKDPVT